MRPCFRSACRRRWGGGTGAAREGLLALSVGLGLGVLGELLETEVDQVVGPKGRHNSERSSVRHGHETGEVTLGGRRVGVSRPRVRTADGEAKCRCGPTSISLIVIRSRAGARADAGRCVDPQYRRAHRNRSAGASRMTPARRRSRRSRAVRGRTREQLWRLMNRRLADVRLAVMMLDGIDLHGRTNIVALGITTEGEKLALGLWEGRPRTPPSRPRCWPTSSTAGWMSSRGCCACSMAPRPSGKPSARCSATTPRSIDASGTRNATCSTTSPNANVDTVERRLRAAWPDPSTRSRSRSSAARRRARRSHPGAGSSLREGMEETLTVTRLGIPGKLKRTLESTNPCESMIDSVRAINRNVKNWSSGEMAMRWTAAGMLEAESQFRKVDGYRGLAQTRDRDRTRTHPPPQPKETATTLQCVTVNTRTAATRISTTSGSAPRLLEVDD